MIYLKVRNTKRYRFVKGPYKPICIGTVPSTFQLLYLLRKHLGGPVATEIHLLKKHSQPSHNFVQNCLLPWWSAKHLKHNLYVRHVHWIHLPSCYNTWGCCWGSQKVPSNHPTQKVHHWIIQPPGALGCVTKKVLKHAHSAQHLSNHISNVQWLYRLYLYPSTNWPKIIDKQFQLEECHSCHSLENKLISAGRYWAKPNAPLDRGWIETCDSCCMSNPSRKLNSK